MKKKLSQDSKAILPHSESGIKNQKLDKNLFEWIVSQREAKISVFTSAILAKGLSVDQKVKKGNHANLIYWIYEFLNQWNLSFRMATMAVHKLHGLLISLRKEF